MTEEARHVRYAREELQRIMPRADHPERAGARNLVHTEVYRSVGITPAVGRKAAPADRTTTRCCAGPRASSCRSRASRGSSAVRRRPCGSAPT
ncbi:hypothetical protein WHI96_18750 [Pseudonocardia tropica]|uniref:Uncharacterized protein n=1 Tax=Pseudonocardia tropica TaxID=681289 RepID=A0ABV1JY07_9PSEU